jgi:photosystem II stability/assembly factor-like uncharacterized protein
MKVIIKLGRSAFIIVIIITIIVATSMAGTWKKTYNGLAMNFNRIKCSDSLNCIAIANEQEYFPYILKSSDGGSSWDTSYKDADKKNVTPYLNDLSYTTKDLCIIACDSGMILRTSNGGKEWEKIRLFQDSRLISIDILDSLNGLLASEISLYKTVDAGINWTAMNNHFLDSIINSGGSFLQAEMLSMTTFIIKCEINNKADQLKMLRTENGGTDWIDYDFPSNCILNMSFCDSLNGWSIGGEAISNGSNTIETDKIVHTTDGGKSWIIQYNDTIFSPHTSLVDVSFIDKEHGIATGEYGKVIITTNGGQTWKPVPDNNIFPDDIEYLFAEYMPNGSFLIASKSGNIYKYVDILSCPDDNATDDYAEIYPNPANDNITLNLNLEKSCNIRISIINQIGQETFINNEGQRVSGPNSFELSKDELKLNPGMYIIKIQIDGKVLFKKLIVL